MSPKIDSDSSRKTIGKALSHIAEKIAAYLNVETLLESASLKKLKMTEADKATFKARLSGTYEAERSQLVNEAGSIIREFFKTEDAMNASRQSLRNVLEIPYRRSANNETLYALLETYEKNPEDAMREVKARFLDSPEESRFQKSA